MEFKLSNIIITIEEKAKIDKQIRSFHLYIMKNLPKCNSTIEASKKKKTFQLAFIHDNGCRRPKLQPSRFRLSNGTTSTLLLWWSRLKRKIATGLANIKENNTSLLVHAASVSAKKEKMGDTAFVLKQTISTSTASTEIDILKANTAHTKSGSCIFDWQLSIQSKIQRHESFDQKTI